MRILQILLVSILVSGCGGGGSTAPAPPTAIASTLSFPLAAGYKARVLAGSTDNFTLSGTTSSGTCTGTVTIVEEAAAPSFFQWYTGYAVKETVSATTYGYTSSMGNSSATHYFDSNYDYVGYTILNSNQWGVVSAPTPLPATVHVGDTGTFAYPSSTYWSQSIKYTIEADTETTAIVNLVTKTRDAYGSVVATQQAKYRIDGAGNLTLFSIDITSPTIHNVLTRI